MTGKAASDQEPGIIVPPDEHREIARNQRGYLRELALRVERGEPISDLDREFIAAALWAVADAIPDQQKRGRGAAPKMDPGALAMEFALLVNAEGKSRTRAMEALADQFQVSTPAVRKALTKYGIARALSLIPARR